MPPLVEHRKLKFLKTLLGSPVEYSRMWAQRTISLANLTVHTNSWLAHGYTGTLQPAARAQIDCPSAEL